MASKLNECVHCARILGLVRSSGSFKAGALQSSRLCCFLLQTFAFSFVCVIFLR